MKNYRREQFLNKKGNTIKGVVEHIFLLGDGLDLVVGCVDGFYFVKYWRGRFSLCMFFPKAIKLFKAL